ncbi:MAG: PD40 domain-containing protein [Caldilineales bacterium]|nr:PD40 domain-containing protein [Caldilineales bacterium]
MTNVIVAAVLFVLGIGTLGAAIFGKLRTRRLILLAVTGILWIIAAIIFVGFGTSPMTDLTAAATETPTLTPEPEPSPTAQSSPTPAPTATATVASTALSGRLVFASQRSGNFDIWDMDLETEDFSQLTRDTANDVEPVYSPDGTMVAFSSSRDVSGGINEIWVMNADGSDQRKLVDWPDSYEWGATWSPDNEWIIFTTTKDFNYEIYAVPVDDSADPINISQAESLESYPDWSPDGRWLAFVSDRGGNWDIWKLDIEACLQARLSEADEESDQESNAEEACEATKLTDNEDDDFFPRWSPDSSQIAFESRRFANRDIYVMDADGGNPTRLTDDVARDSTPIWALDGAAIIFSSERKYDWNMYILYLDSGEEEQLTNFEGEDRFGDWKP